MKKPPRAPTPSAISEENGPVTPDVQPDAVDLPMEWRGPDAVPEAYRLTREGVFEVRNKSSAKVSGPVWRAAETSDAQGRAFGIVLCWIDLKGGRTTAAFPREILHEQSRSLALRLAHGGLEITPGKERALMRYLGSFDAEAIPWLTSTNHTGWLETPDGLAFVCPDRTIPAAHQESVIFQPEDFSPTSTTMRARGSLPQWQKGIADRCRGNAFLIFTLCASFSPPLLQAARMESGGFHLYGRSSRGKTTALQVSASVWGSGADPADSPATAYTLRWNATSNALEALAAAHNDLPLLLDEIGTSSAKDFAQIIYNLSGGRGKSALDRDRGLRSPRSWNTLIISTGEVSSRARIEEDGQTARAGQLLRLVDIPTGEDIVVNTHDSSPDAFVRALKQACGDYFGTAGPAFLDRLVARYPTMEQMSAVLRASVETWMPLLRTSLPAEPAPEHDRILRRLALVGAAGELAAAYGVLPFEKGEIEAALRAVLRAWLSDGAPLSDTVRGLQALQGFLQRYAATRFQTTEGGSPDRTDPVRGLAGYLNKERDLYLFIPSGFQEACGGHNCMEIARELKKRGRLFTNEGARLPSRHMVMIHGTAKRVRFYAIQAAILEDDFLGTAAGLDPQETSDPEKPAGTDGTAGPERVKR